MTEREAKMTSRFWTAATKVDNERLPGWGAFLDGDRKANEYMLQKEAIILRTFRDDDEILFEKAIHGWVNAWERVNEVLAEKYRLANTDAELWELRYIKWMKIVYIHFESEKGDFYLLPRRPRKKPRAEYWYTVDEMLDMLHPTIVAAMKLFDCLPPRPGNMKGPGPGERHLICDYTGEQPLVYYDYIGAPQRG